VSTRVTKGTGQDRLTVTGNLTVHNVTRPVTLDVQVIKVGTNPRSSVPTVGFAATARIKRSDFGLGAFVPQVGDEISLQISCQGAESKAYAAFLQAKEEKQQAKKR
jgi:polyisoprenoid-binding protein YceI